MTPWSVRMPFPKAETKYVGKKRRRPYYRACGGPDSDGKTGQGRAQGPVHNMYSKSVKACRDLLPLQDAHLHNQKRAGTKRGPPCRHCAPKRVADGIGVKAGGKTAPAHSCATSCPLAVPAHGRLFP